jgi:prepilin-type N-terminal cleavage/methylation domain-containing protein
MRKNNSRGFTLIELIIYMGIFSMVLLVLVQIFGIVLDVMGESQAKSSVSQDEEYINLRLGYDIKRAASITTPSALGEERDNLQIVINGENYSYRVTNGKLQITNNSGTDDLNGFDTTVSNLKFKKIGYEDGKDNVIITYTLSSNTIYRGRTEVRSFQTTFGLR